MQVTAFALSSSATITMTLGEAARVVFAFIEGTRPERDTVLETALKMQGTNLETVLHLQDAARRVEIHKSRRHVLTRTGCGHRR